MISALSFSCSSGALSASCSNAVARAFSSAVTTSFDGGAAATEQADDEQPIALAAGGAVGGETRERQQVGIDVERVEQARQFLRRERTDLRDGFRGGVGRHGGVVVEEADDVEQVRLGGSARGAERAHGGGTHGLILVLEQRGDLGHECRILPGIEFVEGVERGPANLGVAILEQRAQRFAELLLRRVIGHEGAQRDGRRAAHRCLGILHQGEEFRQQRAAEFGAELAHHESTSRCGCRRSGR